MKPQPPHGIDPTFGTIAMLGVFALVAGGVVMLRKGDRKRGILMIVCALVILGNVLIWAV